MPRLSDQGGGDTFERRLRRVYVLVCMYVYKCINTCVTAHVHTYVRTDIQGAFFFFFFFFLKISLHVAASASSSSSGLYNLATRRGVPCTSKYCNDNCATCGMETMVFFFETG